MGLALLRKKARIAVELGLTSIKCARFLDKGNILNLDFLEEIDLLQRYRLDSYSKIMDEHYVDSLTEIVERHHIKNTGILMLVPSVSAIVRTLKILSTQVESGLLEEEIKAEIGPIDQTKMEEMQVLCHEIETETPDDHQVPFLVCALPHDTIARSKRIATAAGLKIDILDLDVVG